MNDVFLAAMLGTIALTVFSLLFPEKLVPWTTRYRRLKGFALYTGLSIVLFVMFGVSLEEQPDAPRTQITSSSIKPSTATSSAEPVHEWFHASGNLWTGVKLFYGPRKMEVGVILGGNDIYTSPTGDIFRGVKIRMTTGNEEWKNRDAIIAGNWYVRADDPALKGNEWEVFER